MIDLHIHTNYSDGADTLIEVLNKAEKMNLEVISITDHDNCEVYEELAELDVEKYYSGKIIPGVEIKCAYGNRLIEVLGYKVDTKIINDYMREYHKTNSRERLQQKYFDILYETCIKMGIKLSKKEEIIFEPEKEWASVKIYSEIKKYEENKKILPEDLFNDFTTFSKKYCGNPEFPLFIDKSKDYLTVQQAVQLIKDAGGLVFLPHIYIYKWAEDKNKLLEDLLSKYEIDGIECMHSEFSQEQIDYLLEYTKKHGYLQSGGSDYHGVNKPNIEMAVGKGNLKIDLELAKNWI